MPPSGAAQTIGVSVAYALPAAQWVIELSLPRGARVADALRAAALQPPLRELAARGELTTMPMGIYGELVGLDRVLEDEDRIELYRPLILDPKTARRQRAAGPDADSAATGSES